MNQILYKGEVFGGVGEDVTNKKYEEITIHNPITDMDETFKPLGGQNAEIFNSYKDITDTSTKRNIAACAFSQVNGESNKDLTRGVVGGYNNISGNLNINIDTTFLQENGNSNFIDSSQFAIINGYQNLINKTQFSIISGSNNNINKTDMSTLVESLTDLDEELSPVTIREYGSGIRNYFIDSNNQAWYLDEVFSKENHTFANGCYSKSQDFIVIDRNFKNYTVYKIVIEEWQQRGINYGGYANYVIGFHNEALLQGSDNFNFIFGNKNTLVTQSEHNFISGYNNNIHATRTTIFGQEHLIQNGYDLFVSGTSHKIDDSVGSAVFGSNNKIKKEEPYGSSDYNFISGITNTLTNSYQALICGSEHVVKNAQAPIVFGQRNEVSEVFSSGLVSGYDNKVKKIEKGCAIFGTGNDVGQTFNGITSDGTIVYGDMNKISSSRASIIGGLGNHVQNSIGSFIFGSSTTSNISYNSLIFSLDTEANNITNSLIGGSDSKIDEVADSVVLGTKLSGGTIDDVVQPTASIGQSLVIGYGHTIRYTIASTNILGANHTINTPLYYSTVLGRENTINQNQYSFITGYHNSLTGTSPNSTFNVIGNSNTLTSGDNTLVLGSNNNITGSDANITILGNSNLAQGGNSNTYVFGTGIYVPGGCSNITIFGSYNTRTNINPTTNTSLLIGNGTSDNDRSDAYEIKKDGTQIFYFKDKTLTNTLGIGKITLQQDLITIESLKTNSNNQKESITFTFEELKQLKTISQLPDLDNNQYPNNNI